MQKINLGPIRYWKNSLTMAQSIKKVGNAALLILFKPGTYYPPNHDYNNKKILNRFVKVSPKNITDDLLNDLKKIYEMNAINHYTVGPNKWYYYWGIKSGLQEFRPDRRENEVASKEISLLSGLLNCSDKWSELEVEKISLICSHVIVVSVSQHDKAMYETVLISSVSQDLMYMLAAKAFAKGISKFSDLPN